jgi:hypothetical protein
MRSLIFGACSLAALAFMVSAAPGCGSSDNNNANPDGGDTGDGGACTGFGCNPNGDAGAKGCVGTACQVDCDPGVTTSITGTVLDPAGKVPVFNATVYIPTTAIADLSEGATCDQCAAKVTGNPLVITATDTAGKFKLENVPVGGDLPLVVQIGKWRREITIPGVNKCVDTPLADGTVRLPKNRTEGHIPRIALTTGGADPLQCLLRKVGIDDSEFGIAGSDARIHLYQGGGYHDSQANVDHLASGKFAASVAGGVAFPTAESLWDDPDGTNLKKYDLLLMGCEGNENLTASATNTTAAKSAAAIGGMYKYASAGGRIFASHYHEAWFRTSTDPAVSGVATWTVDTIPPPATPNPPATTAVDADISTAFPKAQAMSDWLGKQGALTNGKLPIYDARADISAVSANALNWISLVNNAPGANATPAIEYMSFNTPVGAADANVCGRVVVNDIHVASGSTADNASADFPDGCVTTDLSAQQKALEFMLFDLSSCVQKDDQVIQPPH